MNIDLSQAYPGSTGNGDSNFLFRINKYRSVLHQVQGESNKEGTTIDASHYAISKGQEHTLKTIFIYYCTQHFKPVIIKTFDDIKGVTNEMLLSDFTHFCEDFKIPLVKSDI